MPLEIQDRLPKSLTSAAPRLIETLGEAILNLSRQTDLPTTLETSHYLLNIAQFSILISVSKLIERHVHDHLYAFLPRFNLIAESQSGFRPIHFCQTCVTKNVNNWLSFINQGDIAGCISLNLRRAFNLLNHDILLKNYNYMFWIIEVSIGFKSYLTCRKQIVCIDTYLPNKEDIHGEGAMVLFKSLKKLNNSCNEVSNWVKITIWLSINPKFLNTIYVHIKNVLSCLKIFEYYTC